MISPLLAIIVALAWLRIGVGCWLGWQLLRQNGRILLRLDEIEKRLDEVEFGEPGSSRREEALVQETGGMRQETEIDQSLVTSAAMTRPSLARSRIKRDGLKAGTSA